MLIPYSRISPNSRVWIYQSDREILDGELHEIQIKLQDFCNEWTSHGKDLHCSFKLFQWFLCFFVDESIYQASGCSIDASVSFIKEIQIQHSINFFNRSNIAFLDANKTRVLSLSDFKKHIQPNIMIYNNMVQTKSDFENEWLIPLKDSWLNKYLK